MSGEPWREGMETECTQKRAEQSRATRSAVRKKAHELKKWRAREEVRRARTPAKMCSRYWGILEAGMRFRTLIGITYSHLSLLQ